MILRLMQPWYLLFLSGAVLLIVLAIRHPLPEARLRKTLSLILRCAVILLLVLGLGELSIAREKERVHVLFLLDMSESLDELSQRESMAAVEEALENMGDSDTAGFLVFGRQPSVEIGPTRSLSSVTFESTVDGSATDISAALNTALAIFPEAGVKRIVLMSDGNENQGRAAEITGLARAAGVQISVYPLAPGLIGAERLKGEIYVKDILVPETARSGEIHQFTAVVHSLSEAAGRIDIFQDDRYAGGEDVVLKPGENSFSYSSFFSSRGLHRYEILISSPFDTIAQNNRFERFVRVQGRPAVLYIAVPGAESRSFLRALEVQGVDVAWGGVTDIPDTMAGLLAYDTVVLDNVPALDLSLAKMRLIEDYVRDTGGGLLMVGGNRSFGLGGYYQTPIEAALPVDVDIASSADIPSLTMVVVADKSGSMGASTESGDTKLDLVKEAVAASLEILNPFYRFGLLAFDADFEWTVPIMEAGEQQLILQRLFRLAPGGGTNLYPALEEATRVLKDNPSAIKHLIVLSDGLTNQGDFQNLAAQSLRDLTTITTVAVGSDADLELMERIAAWGGGRSYYTGDMTQIPRIFVEETKLVSRELMEEETFFPVLSSGSEVMSGLEFSEYPPLHGFVTTYLKSGATAVLTDDLTAPILATYRYGLGRTAAFTSDFGGNWGRDWVRWERFPQFAGQLIRWLERAGSPRVLDAVIKEDRSTGVITVDALDERRRYINFLGLTATVVHPDRSTLETELEQTSPGRYSGTFPADRPGQYFVTIHGGSGSMTVPPETFGMIVPYSREYLDLNANTSLLDHLAESTGGKVLSPETADMTEIFKFNEWEERDTAARGTTGSGSFNSLTFLLTLIALALFLLDMTVRKLRLPGSILRRLKEGGRAGQADTETAIPKESLSYSDLSSIIDRRRREEELAVRREGLMYWYRKDRTHGKTGGGKK